MQQLENTACPIHNFEQKNMELTGIHEAKNLKIISNRCNKHFQVNLNIRNSFSRICEQWLTESNQLRRQLDSGRHWNKLHKQ